MIVPPKMLAAAAVRPSRILMRIGFISWQRGSYQFSVLSSQFSVLSSQFSVLSSHFSVLSSQFSVLSSQFSVLSSQFSVLSSQFSVLSSQFHLRCAVSGQGFTTSEEECSCVTALECDPCGNIPCRGTHMGESYKDLIA